MSHDKLSPELQAMVQRRYPSDWSDLDTRAVDTVRVLAADAVQKCGSGHPGTAMSLAPLAYTLYQRVLNHDPADVHWAGRDRFVLSVGHSSLTQYIQLFLGGFGLELEDLKSLRTWGSKTPGHPEVHHTDGVEITTGPLGQGLASAVGMAMAARKERGLFDASAPAGESPFDHFVYVISSDGDLQEGVTAEASSLAGTQQLGNLIVFWDDNRISIEDDTNIAFNEDVVKRYEAYGWHVQTVESGEDVEALEAAAAAARAETTRPSFIRVKTVMATLPRTRRTPAACTAPPWGRTRWPPPRRSSASIQSSPSTSMRMSLSTPESWPSGELRSTRSGRRNSTLGRLPTRMRRSSSTASRRVSSRRTSPPSCRPGSRASLWPRVRPPRPPSRPWPRPCRRCGVAPLTWLAPTTL